MLVLRASLSLFLRSTIASSDDITMCSGAVSCSGGARYWGVVLLLLLGSTSFEVSVTSISIFTCFPLFSLSPPSNPVFWFSLFEADPCLGDFDPWVRPEAGFSDSDFLEDLTNFLEVSWVCWLFEDFDDLAIISWLDRLGEKLRMIFSSDPEAWWSSTISSDELGLAPRNEVDEPVHKHKSISICKHKIIGYIYTDCETSIYFFL